MNAMGAEAVSFHSKRAVWEISVGLKYHFGCSNGKHYFTKVKPYDQQEVDILNEKINELHSQVGKNTEALEEAARKVTELKTALDKCRNQEPKIVKDTIDNSKKTLESVITFRQGRTTVDNSQLPNVERIATYLKNHKEASVVIKGYASPEGSVEVNDRIARQRAEIVKKMLVNKYGIAEERKLQTTGVTSKMETRYRKSINTNDSHVVLKAHIKEVKRNIVLIEARLYNKNGELCTEAICTYFTFPKEKAKEEMHFLSCGVEDEEILPLI